MPYKIRGERFEEDDRKVILQNAHREEEAEQAAKVSKTVSPTPFLEEYNVLDHLVVTPFESELPQATKSEIAPVPDQEELNWKDPKRKSPHSVPSRPANTMNTETDLTGSDLRNVVKGKIDTTKV